jgi:adenine-specific DNA methylase
MVLLIDNIRQAMRSPRGGRPVCVVCGRAVSERDEQMRLRGGVLVHRACATYEMRRRRTGDARLGYPRAGRL